MSKQNFSDGQAVEFEDFNALQGRAEKVLFDRVAFELIKRAENCFFPGSHEVTRTGNLILSVSAGVGFQTTVEASTSKPSKKMLYLSAPATVNLNAADGINPRIDLLVARNEEIDDEMSDRRIKSAADDSITENSVVISKEWRTELLVVEGVAAAAPTAPAIPAGYILLAELLMDATIGVTAQGNITDQRVLITQGAVESVAGRTGNVTLTSADVGLDNVANKTEIQMVASGAIATSLGQKANSSAISTAGFSGEYSDLLNAPTGNKSGDSFVGDGSTANYTLSADPGSQENLEVVIDGITQLRTAYTLAGLVVTFSENVPDGAEIQFSYGSSIPVGTPADGTITEPKISTGAVTRSKLFEPKQVTKFLDVNRTSSLTDVPILRFTGLVVGRSYEVTSQAYITSNASSGASMFVKHNGVSLHRHNFDAAGSNFAAVASGNSTKFVATATEINIDMSLGASTVIVGSNSTEATWVKVVELPYNINEVANF